LVAYNEGGPGDAGQQVSVELRLFRPVANEGRAPTPPKRRCMRPSPENEKRNTSSNTQRRAQAGVGGSITGTIVKDPSTPGSPSAYEEHQLEIPTGAVLGKQGRPTLRVVAANKQSEKEPHPAEGEVKSFTPTRPRAEYPPCHLRSGLRHTGTFNAVTWPAERQYATQYHFAMNSAAHVNGAGASSTASVEAGKGDGQRGCTTPGDGAAAGQVVQRLPRDLQQFGSQVGPPSRSARSGTYVTDVASPAATLHAVLDREGGASSYRSQSRAERRYGSEQRKKPRAVRVPLDRRSARAGTEARPPSTTSGWIGPDRAHERSTAPTPRSRPCPRRRDHRLLRARRRPSSTSSSLHPTSTRARQPNSARKG